MSKTAATAILCHLEERVKREEHLFSQLLNNTNSTQNYLADNQ